MCMPCASLCRERAVLHALSEAFPFCSCSSLVVWVIVERFEIEVHAHRMPIHGSVRADCVSPPLVPRKPSCRQKPGRVIPSETSLDFLPNRPLLSRRRRRC